MNCPETDIESEYMSIQQMSNIPAKSNPFKHHMFKMGMRFGSNITVMYENLLDEVCEYLIIVNTDTGERLCINITDKKDTNFKFDNILTI